MKQIYNFAREAKERLVQETAFKWVVITALVFIGIIIYAQVAGYIMPQ
jgi:hypothetical protein